jgi:UDP-N-acetylenolpyruvoylglucosamine reductase
MNAGAHGHSLDEVLESVEVFVLAERSARLIPAAEAGYRYRGSSLPEPGVVIAATVAPPATGVEPRIQLALVDARQLVCPLHLGNA